MTKQITIRYMSDLHLEFADLELGNLAADLLVLAGDIHVGTRALDWIKREVPTLPVLYVLGNHEFYRQDYSELREELKQLTLGTNISILDNDIYTYSGINFFGCTLWTDFNLFGNTEKSKLESKLSMYDYAMIKDLHYGRLISPDRIESIHQKSLNWLGQSLKQYSGQKNIVITHHGPSLRSVAAKYIDDPLTPAFVSNLETFIKEHRPNYWIHGHVHNSSSYSVEGCEVRVNTRGYPSEPGTDFRVDAVIKF